MDVQIQDVVLEMDILLGVATGKRVKCTFKLKLLLFVLVSCCLSGKSLVFPNVLDVETLNGLR